MGPGNAPYVTPAQLVNYLPAATLNLATQGQQMQACIDATEEADSYMRGRYQMPLLLWAGDLTKYTAYIAIHNLMSGPVGFASQSGSDSNIEKNYVRAVGGVYENVVYPGWFPGIQRQAIHPDVTPSVTPGQDSKHDMPQVRTDASRCWQMFRRGRPVVGGF